MNPQTVLAGIMLSAVVLYCLLAGADFGAGFWDLVCMGERREQQRALIANAIEPIWETNHVWLILVIVLMFVGFPPAFSSICVALAVPVFLVLLGIVLRGSSYVFRAYFTGNIELQLYWGKVFSISSCMTPFFLGIVIGAISGDSVVVRDGISVNGFVSTWLGPFPFVVGVLSLSLFAYLSACYLTLETSDLSLQEDFRRRALFSGFISLLAAFATYVVAGTFAQGIRDGLARAPHVWLIESTAAAASLVAFQSLWVRKYQRARIAAAAQVGLIILGWGDAQFPFLVRPNLTVMSSASPANVLIDIEIACGLGGLILFPSLFALYYIFKGHRKSVTMENRPS